MKEIVFKVTLNGPVPTTDFLDLEVDKWVKRTRSSADKRKKGLKEAIKTPEDFDKKMHQPQVKTMKAFFKDVIVTRRGLTKADMIAKAESEKDEKCQKYFKKRQESFKDKSFEKGVEEHKRMYEKGRLRYFLLYGSKKEKVKGLISLGIMALCGDKSLREFVDPQGHPVGDSMRGNPVCITSAEKLTEFKKELRSQIAHLGGEIIKAGYDWEMAKYNSERLNRLVDGYRRAEFAPFRAGGASHLDFIKVEIPDPENQNKMKSWLGLDIQVSRI